MDPKAIEIVDQIEQSLLSLLEVAPSEGLLMVDCLLWEYKQGKRAA